MCFKVTNQSCQEIITLLLGVFCSVVETHRGVSVRTLTPAANIHAFQVLSSGVWWEEVKYPFTLVDFLRRGKANVMQAFPRPLISLTATCLYWKLFWIFFLPLRSKHLLLKSSNPLYSLVLHSAAPLLLCVDKSLCMHVSLICPTREDVDGLAGRCRCLLLSLNITPPCERHIEQLCMLLCCG